MVAPRGAGAIRVPVVVSVAERRPNTRLKLPAPGFWEELRLCPGELGPTFNLRGAGWSRRRSLSASR